MALSKETETCVVREGRRVKWPDWADVRDGSVLEVLYLLKGSVRQKEKKRNDRNAWDALDIRRKGRHFADSGNKSSKEEERLVEKWTWRKAEKEARKKGMTQREEGMWWKVAKGRSRREESSRRLTKMDGGVEGGERERFYRYVESLVSVSEDNQEVVLTRHTQMMRRNFSGGGQEDGRNGAMWMVDKRLAEVKEEEREGTHTDGSL